MSDILMRDLVALQKQSEDLVYKDGLFYQTMEEVTELLESVDKSREQDPDQQEILSRADGLLKHGRNITKSIDKDVRNWHADFINYLFDFCSTKTAIKHKKLWVRTQNVGYEAFYGAFPLEAGYSYQWAVSTKVKPAIDWTFCTLREPLNYSTVHINTESAEPYLCFLRDCSINKKLTRSKKCWPFNVQVTQCKITDSGYATLRPLLLGSANGIDWFYETGDKNKTLSVRIQEAGDSYFMWRVVLGSHNSPKIAFVTDASGIKEVFRLRDIPEGAKRRKALHNWVSAHSRKLGDKEYNKTYVRKHLRGELTFTWSGLYCRIIPAKYDIDQNIQYEEQRKIMTG